MKIPFLRGILSSTLLLLLVATVSIWAAGDWSARTTASALVDSLVERLLVNVSERVTRQVQPAMISARTAASLIEEGVVSVDDPEPLLDLLETQAAVTGVDRVYVGTGDGRFFMSVRNIEGGHRHRTVLPAEGLQFWSWQDEHGVDHRQVEEVSYDPRQRTWFELASQEGESWSEVYHFQSDGQLGITASVPVDGTRDQALVVAGADITVADLSGFLSDLEVSPRGRAFLLDDRGKLVAHPDASMTAGADGALLPAAEAPDPVVRALALHRGAGLDSKAEIESLAEEVDGERWRLLRMPLATGEDIPPFILGVAIPESDFLGALQKTRLISAVIALISLLLGIVLAVALARGVSRPILQLQSSMSAVGSFDLDVKTDIDTLYVELQQMVSSFQRMVGGLRSFSRYVPRDLVRDVLGSGRQAELGAEERELSMYFSDIAGFTTLAERADPQELVAQLGEYLEEVVTVIRSQGGTIDKFIGDAVMALWNAPKPQPDHPLGAALAAIDAVSVVDRLNERWAAEGKPAMQTRIGISTASVVVGNIGSSQRLSYTALGDGVNLTARLEGANKGYGTSILASQALISRLPAGVVAAQAVDILVVRGKAEGVRIYEILGRAGEVPGHRLEAAGIYEEAFELYLARDFGRAARLFRQVSELLPGYRPAELLLDRCLLFAADPPSETWDGSFALNTK